MSYNYELDVSADISTQVTEAMIRHIVEKQTNRKITAIEAKITDGKFAGFHVTFDAEQPSGSKVSRSLDKVDNTFKVTTYS